MGVSSSLTYLETGAGYAVLFCDVCGIVALPGSETSAGDYAAAHAFHAHDDADLATVSS